MSKECRKCDNFMGYDDDTGYPECSLPEGAEGCPYNDEVPFLLEDGTRIEIDIEYMKAYIRHTMQNTFKSEARRLAEDEIKAIAKEAYESEVQSVTKQEVERIVRAQVDEFMKGSVTVGGGWMEPARTLSRVDYMNELVQKTLEKEFSGKGIRESIERIARDKISDFTKTMQRDINTSIKNNFDAATRDALTANVVNLLMANDTFRKLSDNMSHMIQERN